MAKEDNIVVLGCGLAGIGVAHYLLRHTIPAVKNTSSQPTAYKVILVSPSTQLYWQIASPRALVNEKLMPIDKTFTPIQDGFNSYHKSSFEFIHGVAVGMDHVGRQIEIQLGGSKERMAVGYHALVIATGASSANPIWSVTEGHEVTRAALQEMQRSLPTAKTVIIAGGGPAGVESAGEIGGEYGTSKKITLLCGSNRLLGKLRPAIGQLAQNQLEKLGVKVRYNLRVESTSHESDGQTLLKLSDGTTMATDVYVDATGLHPNATFVPAALLDSGGRVKTDPQTLRVQGAGPRVYAIGSVASYSDGGTMDVRNAMSPLMGNIEYDLSDGRSGKEKQYSRMEKEMMVVPIGRKGGVGALFGWKLPSTAVWFIKGRSYFIDMLPGARDGSQYVKKV